MLRTRKVIWTAALAAVAFGQEVAPPVDPLSDRLRYEIAAAQRDFLMAKQQYEQATAQLKSKFDQADKVCEGKFDLPTFTCASKSPDKK